MEDTIQFGQDIQVGDEAESADAHTATDATNPWQDGLVEDLPVFPKVTTYPAKPNGNDVPPALAMVV